MTSSKDQTKVADPLIDEVRAIRKAICDRFDNDVDKLGEYYRKVDEDFIEREDAACNCYH